MKNQLKKQLIKDLIILGISWTVFGILFSMDGSVLMGVISGFMCAGFPFGWRWTSKIFTALSFYTVIMKVLISIFAGWIAAPIIIIKDIVCLATAR